MKKAISIVLAVLMAMPFAFARERDETAITGHFVYSSVGSGLHNSVAVCTNRDNSKGYVVANLQSQSLLGRAIEKAKQLLSGESPTKQYSNSFACVSATV